MLLSTFIFNLNIHKVFLEIRIGALQISVTTTCLRLVGAGPAEHVTERVFKQQSLDWSTYNW